jgi:large subunit ribosomal protein L24
MDKIQKDDDVVVLVGKDKGKRGIVKQRIDANYVVVDGVNIAKKAVKPNPMTGIAGGIVDKLMPIHVSNLALFNVVTGKADRVGFKDISGKKARVFKSSGEVVKV